MHELSIATEIIETVLNVAAEHRVNRVQEVILEVGPMRLVVPEALETAFEAVAKRTIAEGAKLTVVETPLRVRCRGCGNAYDCHIDDFLCPACGQADIEIIEGNDILLKSVVCQKDEGTETE